MNELKLLSLSIITIFLLNGCDRILEPVSFNGKLIPNIKNQQEKFSIDIKPLTFSSASIANKDPYPRKLMIKGSGSNANVLKETDLLTTKMPRAYEKPKYIIGIEDEISFTIQSEFKSGEAKWPKSSKPHEYLIGIGDVLTFIQQNKSQNALYNGELLLKTEGIVGTDNNILLLGIGSISAGNRTLSDIRAEVRNILIRDGIAPNFQLEITGFNSKKAYLKFVTAENNIPTESNIVAINNIPITLHEIVLRAGISHSSKNKAIITLTRNLQSFRMTAKQLLNSKNLDVYIQDKDMIEIMTIDERTLNANSIVDSNGYILLPNIGKIKVEGKTISEVQEEAAKILSKKGLKSKFQLELSSFKSKVAYLTIFDQTNVVPITDKNITIKELLLNNSSILNNSNKASNGELKLVTLKRNGKEYQSNIENILINNNKDTWVQDNDQFEVKNLEYKLGQVFALSGSSSAKIISINPSRRETLADILFVEDGALNNNLAQRSEVYLLRGRKPSKAYHLDAQNVSRLLVAAKTELRPNDIIFVAQRPIISFARTLAEITPLRILLRDIENDNIP
mgnify:CR=1 FL=1